MKEVLLSALIVLPPHSARIIHGGRPRELFGGIAGGTWANSYLFMIELIMAYTYFTHFRQDPSWLKTIVASTLLVDTTSTINHYACAYMYTVLHWGDREFLQNQSWPFPVYLVTTGASAFIVQQFLIYRFWSLSRNWFVTPLLALASLSAFGGALATAVIVVQHSTFGERGSVRVPVTIWLVFSAVADVSIAGILIYTLHRHKSPFTRTKNMIKQLTTLAIQTGAPGSVVATIALIVYLSDPDGNISVGIGFTLGRIYAITLLNNLISRARLRRASAQTLVTALGEIDISTNPGIRHTHPAGEPGSQGIHVMRTALVHIDSAKSTPIERQDDSVDEAQGSGKERSSQTDGTVV